MSRFLGDFTAAVEEHRREAGEDATFELYGETFTMAPSLAGLPYLQFAKAATSGLDTADMEASAAMLDFVKGCVTDEDWPRFADLVARKRVSSDGLMALVTALVEQFTGGPTSLPSDSDGGQSTTTPVSRTASSKPSGPRRASSAA